MSTRFIPSQTDFSAIALEFKGSTVFERPGSYGLSHLMEHLLCKKLFPHMSEFTTHGLGWNAYTSSDNIVFHMVGLSEYLFKYLTTFLEVYKDFKISEQTFNSEKAIVYQEYSDSFSRSLHVLLTNISRKYFNDYQPIGDGQDILGFTYEQAQQYYADFLVAPTSIYFINNYANANFTTSYRLLDKINLSELREDLSRVVTKSIYEITPIPTSILSEDSFAYVLHSDIISLEDIAYVDFILAMFGMGLESPLYEIVREKYNYAYSISAWPQTLNAFNQYVAYVGCTSKKDNLSHIDQLVREILFNKDYLTLERYTVIKKNFDIEEKKKFILPHLYLDSLVRPDEEKYAYIRHTLTYDKILEIHQKYFKPENFVTSTTLEFPVQ